MSKPIRILIVDDHTVVRQALRSFLSAEPDLDVVAEAGSGEEALRQCRALRPDVVLMDLLMPGVGGINATRAIRRECPQSEVVALTSALDNATVTRAIKAGAISYMLKTTDADGLRAAIRAAAAGKVQLSPEAAAHLVREVRASQSPQKLTRRETEILRLLARGKANKEIARALGITEQTAKTHVRHILAKLQVQSRTQAALCAIQLGLASAGVEPATDDPEPSGRGLRELVGRGA